MALKRLVRSRKFLLALLDVVIALVLFFGTKYAAPVVFEDIQFLILTLQPVFVAIIAAIAYEDAAFKRTGRVVLAYQKEPAFVLLLRSRKFLLLCLDVVISIAIYFVGKYAALALEDVKFAILTLQPLVVLLIGSIAYEDGATLSAPAPGFQT